LDVQQISDVMSIQSEDSKLQLEIVLARVPNICN
jgi:hypothetical protein